MLMACAPDGQRRPGLAASADLIRSGLRMRLRPSVPRSAPTVRAAVRLMYAGAAVTTLSLIVAIISVAFVGRRRGPRSACWAAASRSRSRSRWGSSTAWS